MLNLRLRTIAIITGAAFVLGLLLGFFGHQQYEGKARAMPSDDGAVSRVTVTPDAPLRALDKGTLRARKAIPKALAEDPGKAVLATGKVDDDSGKRTAAAILDLDTGSTLIVEARRFAERMDRWEAGAGIGMVDGSTAKGATLKYTFGRVWNVYAAGSFEVFDVERDDNRHPWTAMLWVTARW